MRAAAIALAAIGYLAAVLLFRPHPTPGPIMRDFEAYYAAGATWAVGGDAYGRVIFAAESAVPGVNAARQETLPFINPPIALPFFALLARLPYDTAVKAWAIVLALALGLLIVATLALAGLGYGWRSMAAAVPLALAFGPVSSDLALGQAALIAVAAVVGAGWALSRKSRIPAALATCVAAALATCVALVQPALAVPLAVWWRSWRGAAALLAGGLMFSALWLVLRATLHVPGIVAYARTLRAHATAERFALIQYTPAAVAHGLGVSDGVALALGTVVALGAIAGWLLFAARRGRTDPLAAFASACALLPLALPFFHEHDFTLLWFPCVFVLVRCTADRLRGSLALLATLCIAIDWLGIAQRPGGATQALLLLVALTAAGVALAPTADQRIASIALVPAALVVGAVLLAQHHPAPVWPDAMRPLSLPAGASIAAVWHAEQAAAGMFARSTFFALLRVPPLIGCVMIAWLSLNIDVHHLVEEREGFGFVSA